MNAKTAQRHEPFATDGAAFDGALVLLLASSTGVFRLWIGRVQIFDVVFAEFRVFQAGVDLLEEKNNKTVYTTASVAYGWAGGIDESKITFRLEFALSDGQTDRPTDGPNDRKSN